MWKTTLGNTTFLAFSTPAEKLIGTTAERISLIRNSDKFVLPDVIRGKLIGKIALFTVSIARRVMDQDNISFRVNTSIIVDKGPTLTSLLQLPAPTMSEEQPHATENKSSTQKIEAHSPSIREVLQDLFQQDTPVKEPKTI